MPVHIPPQAENTTTTGMRTTCGQTETLTSTVSGSKGVTQSDFR